MPDALKRSSTPEERAQDRKLLGSLALCVTAAAIQVIVGFCVAHWTVLSASKVNSYVVSVVALVLCASGAVLAFGVRSQLGGSEETAPENGRRLFMANLNLMVACLVTALILAVLIAVTTIQPNA